ncbi:MAG TPA: ELM1/GtrOC1 family putative glycosyltransferase [Vineibacter sp.]|nr:ELM1/GtrOC1 family putative glycosyltransferase [Vineibacter sp.]
MQGTGGGAPQLWLLTGDKGGDTAQLRVLSRALGWPTTEKPLQFNGLYRLPNRLLGATVATLADVSAAGLEPPWPDVVLSAGRRATPVARSIRARSGGRSKLIAVGRPWASLGAFDLVIATPQYGVPARANVLSVALPFNRLEPTLVHDAVAAWAPQLAELKPPFLTLLIGGRARPLRFDGDVGRGIGREANNLARALGASVLAVSSRRTPADVLAAMLAEIKVPLLAHPWRSGDTSNAYAAFVGVADRLVVTGDSASMIAEACHSGKPVTVAPVPFAQAFRERLPRGALSLLSGRTIDTLHAGGWIVRPRDIATLWQALARDGHVHVLGEALVDTVPPDDPLPAAVARIRALVG